LPSKNHEHQPDELMRRTILDLNRRLDVFKNFTIDKLAEVRAELLVMQVSLKKDSPHSTNEHIKRLIKIIDHIIKEVKNGDKR